MMSLLYDFWEIWVITKVSGVTTHSESAQGLTWVSPYHWWECPSVCLLSLSKDADKVRVPRPGTKSVPHRRTSCKSKSCTMWSWVSPYHSWWSPSVICLSAFPRQYQILAAIKIDSKQWPYIIHIFMIPQTLLTVWDARRSFTYVRLVSKLLQNHHWGHLYSRHTANHTSSTMSCFPSFKKPSLPLKINAIIVAWMH